MYVHLGVYTTTPIASCVYTAVCTLRDSCYQMCTPSPCMLCYIVIRNLCYTECTPGAYIIYILMCTPCHLIFTSCVHYLPIDVYTMYVYTMCVHHLLVAGVYISCICTPCMTWSVHHVHVQQLLGVYAICACHPHMRHHLPPNVYTIYVYTRPSIFCYLCMHINRYLMCTIWLLFCITSPIPGFWWIS